MSNPSTATRTDILAGDGHAVGLRIWPANGSPRAVVQILHGLAEHIDRYDRFAQACNARGYAVVGHNHRGHGEQADDGQLGHFADRDGWQNVINDVGIVFVESQRKYPATPRVLFGHSMGSYIAQSFVMRESPDIDALILSGSTWPNRREVTLARFLARFMRRFRGKRTASRLFDEMLFKKYNQKFSPNRTGFDWLSRDDVEVDRYVADPLCGARSTYGLWFELFSALLEISDSRAITRIQSGLPILITGGEVDPVGGKRPLTRLVAEYEAAGHERVALKLYEDGRHEILNDINRDEVTRDLLAWIDGVI